MIPKTTMQRRVPSRPREGWRILPDLACGGSMTDVALRVRWAAPSPWVNGCDSVTAPAGIDVPRWACRNPRADQISITLSRNEGWSERPHFASAISFLDSCSRLLLLVQVVKSASGKPHRGSPSQGECQVRAGSDGRAHAATANSPKIDAVRSGVVPPFVGCARSLTALR